MIDADKLKSIAKTYGMKPWQQEKHYVQTVALVALSDYPLVFKGGTYLWFFHNLRRFSEDLDFTANGLIPKDIHEKVSTTLNMFGIETKIKIVTDDERGFSFRMSAKGPLYTSEFDLCHVYIEISKRENLIKETEPFKLNVSAYDLPVKLINGMNLNEICAEKVRAIITRDKSRDLYDLFFLITQKGIIFDKVLVNEKMKYYDIIFSKDTFVKKLKKKKDSWNKELKQLVFEEPVDFDIAFESIAHWATGDP